MITKIKISGQISGNFTLARKLSNYEDSKSGMFNSFYLTYRSKAEAQKDLSEAYRKLKEYDPEDSNLYIYRDAGKRPYKITYDASRAEILDNN